MYSQFKMHGQKNIKQIVHVKVLIKVVIYQYVYSHVNIIPPLSSRYLKSMSYSPPLL